MWEGPAVERVRKTCLTGSPKPGLTRVSDLEAARRATAHSVDSAAMPNEAIEYLENVLATDERLVGAILGGLQTVFSDHVLHEDSFTLDYVMEAVVRNGPKTQKGIGSFEARCGKATPGSWASSSERAAASPWRMRTCCSRDGARSVRPQREWARPGPQIAPHVAAPTHPQPKPKAPTPCGAGAFVHTAGGI